MELTGCVVLPFAEQMSKFGVELASEVPILSHRSTNITECKEEEDTGAFSCC